MGQKVNPNGYRIGINKPWKSTWFANKKEYRQQLLEDIKIRKYLKEKLMQAGLARIGIERMGNRVRITLNTSRPGIVIGKKGAEIDKLKRELKRFTDSEVLLVIREVKKPEINALLIGENIAMQIQRRVAFRRAMKKAVLQAMKSGALGIRVACSGRLAGADMARTEWYIKGRVPLQTLRADIDYGTTEALTTYGIIGIKVWVFTGEVLEDRGRTEAGE
ncbi:30S ribosomal protein S3 [Seleniivibrio sp.]|uniref:30S ribosomal protein S3 n=1 Tax=Seleniivibrio sp. TaxID=2898801 RepID=UPI0025D1F7C4|nr:30S ribosomal protein S3 [Seleniivibrio sp.]MCD8552471.1 30S ribosomal protein S3 [Seleniivibrio sp.]